MPAMLTNHQLTSCPRPGALWIGMVTLLLGVAALAQSPPSAPKTVPELKAFYQQNCTRCHGADGSARTLDGRPLGGLDFTKATKEFRQADGPAAQREIRTMTRVIRKGLLFGFSMPGWKDQLSEEEASLMVKEVLLKAEAGKPIKADS